MIQMTKFTSSKKIIFPLTLGIALALVSGCSKQEESTADHADAKAPEVQSVSAPVPVSPEIKTALPVKPVELPPLPAEMMALVASNRTASAPEQIYYVTNSAFTTVQKAQTLMMILPSFSSRDDQRAVAHAAVNYVTDATHGLVSQPLLEGKLHPQLLSIFMTDTLKRPDAIKIPILQSIAGSKDHPLQGEAQELLVAFSKPTAQQQASNKMD
jgi:hypothetical protein